MDLNSPFTFHVSLIYRIQIHFRIKGCHTTGSCRCYRLLVDLVLYVSGSKHPGDRSCSGTTLEPAAGDDIAAIHLYLPFVDMRVRLVPNGDETAVNRDVQAFAGFFPDPYACYSRLIAKNL